MYNDTVAPLESQSFQNFEAENFFLITNWYPTLQIDPESATIPAKEKNENLLIHLRWKKLVSKIFVDGPSSSYL